jgi:hypothetical protein
MGGTASLVAAGQEGVDVEAVIALGSDVDRGLGRRATPAEPLGGQVVRRRRRRQDAAAAAELYAISHHPARRDSSADDHGTDLLTGAQAEVVKRLIEIALSQYAPS